MGHRSDVQPKYDGRLGLTPSQDSDGVFNTACLDEIAIEDTLIAHL
jgi:hypothetical protein